MNKSFIFSIFIFYMLTTAFTSIFIDKIFKSMFLQISSAKIYMFIVIVFLIFMFFFICLKVYEIIIKSKKEDIYIKLRIKIILAFLAIALLSSVPQTVISSQFVVSSLKNIYSSYNKKALIDSYNIYLKINKNIENEMINTVNIFTNSYDAESLEEDSKNTWKIIKSINSSMSCLQVFLKDNNQLKAFGKNNCFIKSSDIKNYPNMHIVKTTKDKYSFISIKKEFENYFIILTSKTSLSSENEILNIYKSINYMDSMNGVFSKNKKYSFLLFYIMFVIPIFLISAYLSFIISDTLLYPLSNFSTAMSKIIAGDYSYKIILYYKSDFYYLANSFNMMSSEIESAQRKLMNAKKIETLKEVSTKLAHEIKNPLTPIKLSTQRLIRKYQQNLPNFDLFLKKYTDIILNEVDYIVSILEEFSSFSRLPQANLKKLQLAKVIKNCINLFEEYKNISIKNNLTDDIFVHGDELQLNQVFKNLFKNAQESIDINKGIIDIDFDKIVKNKKQYISIRFYNTGKPIPNSVLKNIFNPYFTTKEKGTGLGLAITYKIIEDHEGDIWAENTENGVIFFINLAEYQS